MCGGLFSFCFLHETVFGNGQVAITHNGGMAVTPRRLGSGCQPCKVGRLIL